MDVLIVQFIGAIAYLLLSASYYKKDKSQILFLQIIANVFFAIHYYILGGITGGSSNLVGLIAYFMIFICDKYDKKITKNVLALCMICLLLIITYKTYQNIYSVLPFISFALTTISFLDGEEKSIRLFGLVAAVCWLIYAIVYDSYVSIIFETITLIATAGSIIRSKIKLKQNN